MNRSLLNIFVTLFVLTATAVPVAFAAGTGYGTTQPCTPYGGVGCPTENILINKMVQNPQTSVFVDNLGVNDPKYGPDATVFFQLTISNTGNTVLNKVTVKDIFPEFVTFNAGAGNYDANSKTLTFDLQDLKPGESRAFVITGKVASIDKLPQDKGIVCVTNQSFVSTNGKTSQDNARFCIQKPVLGGKVVPVVPTETKGGQKIFPKPEVTTTPPTGPEALALVALVPSALAGFVLRKKA